MTKIERGSCWQCKDDEDDCLWVRGIDVDGVHLFMEDNQGRLYWWTRDSLFDDRHQVEND